MQFKEMPTFLSRSVMGRMKNNISCNCKYDGILLFLLMAIRKTIVIIVGHKEKINYRNEHIFRLSFNICLWLSRIYSLLSSTFFQVCNTYVANISIEASSLISLESHWLPTLSLFFHELFLLCIDQI